MNFKIFASKISGQFESESGGQFNRYMHYAAEKASLATDYTFACYDRDEVEMNPQYLQRRADLFHEIGWTDANGNWTELDKTVIENVGHQIVSNLIKE